LCVFLMWDRLHDLLAKVELPSVLRLADWYERLVRAVPAAAKWVTHVLQGGRLTGYVGLLVGFVTLSLGGVAWASLRGPSLPLSAFPAGGRLAGRGLAVLGAAGMLATGAIAASVVRDSFVLLLASGLVGLACALLFLFLGAPDLAFTQFAV